MSLNAKLSGALAIFLQTMFGYGLLAQRNSSIRSHHELSTNAFNLFVIGAPNASYEYLANENITFGLGLLYNIKREDPRDRYLLSPNILYRVYSITPFIRRYFSRKYARGFFIEGFGMLSAHEDYITTEQSFANETVTVEESKRFTHFTLGLTVGGKFLWGKKGVIFETNFGYGIPGVFGKSSLAGAVTRGGVTLGYRF